MHKRNSKIPFVYQGDGTSKCGAACICMLLKCHGQDISLESVWEGVIQRKSDKAFSPVINCGTTNMMNFLLKAGFMCSVVSFDSIEHGLSVCNEHEVSAILHMHVSEVNLTGHFVLLLQSTPKYVFAHDPMRKSGANRRINMPVLRRLMHSKGPNIERDMKRLNTFMLVSKIDTQPIIQFNCPHCHKEFNTYAYAVPPIVTGYVCPNCDTRIFGRLIQQIHS